MKRVMRKLRKEPPAKQGDLHEVRNKRTA
jgi:hypothetical protein